MHDNCDRPPQRTTPPTEWDKRLAEWVRRSETDNTRIVVARGEVERVTD